MPKIIPEPLHQGDEVRVVAPSTGIKIIGADSREIAASRFAEMGLKVSFGANTIDENFDMMGTSSIKKRADDINAAFSDPKVKAIFTIIGGFNSNQLLPFLDYNLIKKNPKIFCGFSDITALLNGIYAKTNMVTFLGPHYSSFGMKYGFDYSFAAAKQMLMGEGKLDVEPSAEWSDDPWFIDQEKREFIKNEGWWQIRAGEACGTLMGGNLGTLTLLLGSPYWWGSLSVPMATFLMDENLAGKTVYPFITSGSSSPQGALDRIRELCPQAKIGAHFYVPGAEAADADNDVAAWLKKIGF